MKIAICTLVAFMALCESASGAEPYTYRPMEKQDTSYGATKRMVYRVYLNTQGTPDQDRMKATAERIWRDGNRRWNEFTVFMIFGQIKNFDTGAYGIAEFKPSGMTEFRINKVPLQMLEITREKPEEEVSPVEEKLKENSKVFVEVRTLGIGQAFFVSRETPVMPEFEPEDHIAAIQQMKKIPKAGLSRSTR